MRVPDTSNRFEYLVSEPPSHLPIEQAAVRSVAYADVFEYPLRAAEVHRYLHGVSALDATAHAPKCSLRRGAERRTAITRSGKEDLARYATAGGTCRGWPAALKYGRLIAGPFVRWWPSRIARVGNVEPGGIDTDRDRTDGVGVRCSGGVGPPARRAGVSCAPTTWCQAGARYRGAQLVRCVRNGR